MKNQIDRFKKKRFNHSIKLKSLLSLLKR